nr:nuclear receptor subfamily 1 group I member 3 isoform X4 [Aotus nancymaae]
MATREDELRSCVVCGDQATGYHFNALTCEGCKGFFRRTVSKSTGPTCPFAGSCEVSKAQRRHCPACRLQKCLDAGMRKDMILSAEALALRRAKQAQRRAQQTPMQLTSSPSVHPSPALAHPGPRAASARTLRRHQHFHGAASHQVYQGPAPLPNFLCGPLRYTIEDGARVGFQVEFLELLLHFHGTLRKLQLQEPEYVLLAAMALFSPDRPGVTQRDEIDQLQEEMALTLQSYIKGQQQRPRDRFLYAKLLGLLAELRSINEAYGYQIQHIQGLSAMMLLLQEICS